MVDETERIPPETKKPPEKAEKKKVPPLGPLPEPKDFWPPKTPGQQEAWVRHAIEEGERIMGPTPEKDELIKREVMRRLQQLREQNIPLVDEQGREREIIDVEKEAERIIETETRKKQLKERLRDPLYRETEQMLGGVTPERQQLLLEQLAQQLQEYKEMGYGGYEDIVDPRAEAARLFKNQMEALRQKRGYGLDLEKKREIIEAAERGTSVAEKERNVLDALGRIQSDIYAVTQASIAEPFQLDLDRMIQLSDIAETINRIEDYRVREKVAAFNSWYSTMRRDAHNAMYSIETGKVKPDRMVEFMQTSGEVFDVLLRIEGVASAWRDYEKVLDQMRVRGGNWIQPEDLMFRTVEGKEGLLGSKVDIKVSELFREKLKRGAVDGRDYGYDPETGRMTKEGKERFKKEWPEWKIGRALALAKSFGAMTLRPQHIIAATWRPKKEEMMRSEKYEDFVRTLNPLNALLAKFGGFGPTASVYYYFITGQQKRFKDRDDVFKHFMQLKDNPEDDRVGITNFWGYYAGPTGSGWRMKESVSEELRKNSEIWQDLGLKMNLVLLDGEEKDRKRELEDGRTWKGKKETKEEIEEDISKRKKKAFEIALDRSPMTVFRLLIDEGLDEKGEPRQFLKYQKIVNEKAFGREKVSTELLDKIENEIFVLQEQVLQRNIKEKDPKKKVTKTIEDFYSTIKNPQLQDQVRKYVSAIKEVVLDKNQRIRVKDKKGRIVQDMNLLEALVDKKQMAKRAPFTIGPSDTPLEILEAAKAGHVGWARAWRDYNDTVEATKAMMALADKLPATKKPEDLAELIHNFYFPLQDIDWKLGRDAAVNLAKGIIMGARKHHWWLPAPLEGFIYRLFDQPQSYFQDLWGTGGLEWNKMDARNFLKYLRVRTMIDEKEEKELQDELKLRRRDCALEFFVKWGPAALLVIFYSWIKRLYEETVKELTEEG